MFSETVVQTLKGLDPDMPLMLAHVRSSQSLSSIPGAANPNAATRHGYAYFYYGGIMTGGDEKQTQSLLQGQDSDAKPESNVHDPKTPVGGEGGSGLDEAGQQLLLSPQPTGVTWAVVSSGIIVSRGGMKLLLQGFRSRACAFFSSFEHTISRWAKIGYV